MKILFDIIEFSGIRLQQIFKTVSIALGNVFVANWQQAIT